MYMVYLVNSGSSVIIHDFEPCGSIKAVGKIKKAVNAIDSFTFTLYPGNPGFDAVLPLKSRIYVYNDSGVQIFAGRVLKPTGSMDSTGTVSRTFVCEGELGYLCDTVQKYRTVGTTYYFFQKVIEQHNSQVGSDKQISLGDISVNKQTHRRTWGYMTSFEAINEYVNEYGGEFRLRYDNGVRYLDYTDYSFISASDTPIELAVNMISVGVTDDPTKIASGIFAAGAKLTNDGTSAERLELDDVIWDNDLIALYGKVVACVTWDDVTTESALSTKAAAWLQDQSSEIRQFTVTAAQLYEVSYGFDDFEVGMTYPIRNSLIGLDDRVRCVSKTIDINDPTKTTLTFGDSYTSISRAIAKNSKQSQEISRIGSSVASMDASITNLKRSSSSFSESIAGLQDDVSGLDTRLTAAEEAISGLSTDIVYSAEERLIGKWIDDSDLFEKTIVIPALGDSIDRSVQVLHGIEHLGETVESRGQLVLSDGSSRPLCSQPLSGGSATSYTVDRSAVTVTREALTDLWDGEYPNIDASVRYKAVNVGNGTFTLTTTTPKANGTGCALFLLAGSVSTGAYNSVNGVSLDAPRTATASGGYVTVAYRIMDFVSPAVDPRNYQTVLTPADDLEGSMAYVTLRYTKRASIPDWFPNVSPVDDLTSHFGNDLSGYYVDVCLYHPSAGYRYSYTRCYCDTDNSLKIMTNNMTPPSQIFESYTVNNSKIAYRQVVYRSDGTVHSYNSQAWNSFDRNFGVDNFDPAKLCIVEQGSSYTTWAPAGYTFEII